jgi:hypothetical protein
MARRKIVEAQADYYALLQVTPRASSDEISAAYARLQDLYSPERMANAAPEFQEQAAQKRQQFEAAFQELSSPSRRAAYDQRHGFGAAQPLDDPSDFRPLPPARGKERALQPEWVAAERAAPAARGRRAWLSTLIAGALVVAVLLLVARNDIRTTDGSAAVPTPALATVTLPFSDVQLRQFRAAAESVNSAQAWAALGNAIFDNMQTLRENAPSSPQYRGSLNDWLAVTQAYDRALAVQDDPIVRSDRAVALFNYGLDAPDGQRVTEAVADVDRAVQAGVTAPRALINYGLILAQTNPARTEEALSLWRKVGEVAPDSSEAEQAQSLLERYGQREDDQ